MSCKPSSFIVLPWTLPGEAKNFVPNRSRSFVSKDISIFFAWRDCLVLIFTFKHNCGNLSEEKPVCSQFLTSKQSILDVVVIENCIFFVSPTGLFQILSSENVMHSSHLLKHLGKSKSFSLSDAFELSPLQRILAVATPCKDDSSSQLNSFAVIACSRDNNNINAELYSLLLMPSLGFKLEMVNPVHVGTVPDNDIFCFSSFLTKNQTKRIFCEDRETILVGLSTGHLLNIPLCLPTGVKQATKLLYQSQWRIQGLTCPPDGNNIFLFLEGGTVLNISPRTSELKKSHQSSLSYTSFTLPYPMKHFSVPAHNQIVVSDFRMTSAVHVVSPEETNVEPVPIRGITTMSEIPISNLVVAATLHGDFYLLDLSYQLQKGESLCSSIAGCSLDLSLQIVQDMEKQTEILSQLRNELEKEDSLIKALSTVTRSHFLTNHFKMTVKVIKTFGSMEQDEEVEDRFVEVVSALNSANSDTLQKYQISVVIENNSPEDFDPTLWTVSLEIRNPDGIVLTKNVHLSRIFSQNLPFSTILTVPLLSEKPLLPILVQATLVSEIKEDNVESQWLKLFLSSVTLDISYFFSISFQPPQLCLKKGHTFATFLAEIQSKPLLSTIHSAETKEKEKLTSYIIPVPEKFRKPKIIMDKIQCNCFQRHKLSLGKDFLNQGEKTVMWICLMQNVVKLELRESCSSITLSSSNLQLLHAVKLYLKSVFYEETPSKNTDVPSEAGYSKARNLNAVLEAVSLKEVDSKQLLIIHRDLRKNVASQVY